jgi:hypothetical protein
MKPRADYSLEGKFIDTFTATSLLVHIYKFLNVKRCEFDCEFGEGGGVCAHLVNAYSEVGERCVRSRMIATRNTASIGYADPPNVIPIHCVVMFLPKVLAYILGELLDDDEYGVQNAVQHIAFNIAVEITQALHVIAEKRERRECLQAGPGIAAACLFGGGARGDSGSLAK